MRIRMENIQALTPDGITGFLDGSAGIEFTGQSRAERYAWIAATLTQQQYCSLRKKQRGAVRALLSKVAGRGWRDREGAAGSSQLGAIGGGEIATTADSLRS
jgi:hypothetical protein